MLHIAPFPFLCHYENPGACFDDNAQPDADARPILSVDVSPRTIGNAFIFATGGGDSKARVCIIKIPLMRFVLLLADLED